MGAGLEREKAQTARAAAGVADTVTNEALSVRRQMLEQERERAEDTQALEWGNRFAEWEQKRLYDPETGAMAQRGKAAMDLPEKISEEFGELASQLEATATTPRQRAMFAKIRSQREQSLNLTVRRHVFEQMGEFEATEFKNFRDNARSAAITNALDPMRVQLELGRITESIEKHGPRLGMGPEAIKAAIEDERSAVHAGVVERLIDTDHTRAAEVYFEEAKSQITDPKKLAEVEKALQAGTLRRKAQAATDEILAKHSTLTEQREAAKQLDDELRDEVTRRLEHEATIRDRAERERDEAAATEAYNLIDAAPTRDLMTLPGWTKLSGSVRTSLRTYQRSKIDGVPIVTNWKEYTKLMDEAGNEPEKFAKRNLLESRSQLDDVEYKQLVQLQLGYRPGGDRRKSEGAVDRYKNTKDVMNATLGVNPNAPPSSGAGKAYTQLHQLLDRRVFELEQKSGERATTEDIQGVLDELLKVRITVVQGTGSAWSLFPGGTSKNSVTKSILELQYSDIPSSERKLLEEALRSKGRATTNENVLALYIDTHTQGGR